MTKDSDPLNKKTLSEADICAKFITPAITSSGWNELTQIQREVHFTKGQIYVRGKLVTRGKSKFADYILYYRPQVPIAIVEAKDNNHSVGDGMQQALDYAEILNVPFVFSSNGDGFLFHDRAGIFDQTEMDVTLADFPSPEFLWAKYCQWKGITEPAEDLVLADYFEDGTGRSPRYYQQNAVDETVTAMAEANSVFLLVMATGTGKTYTAFQIIWKLWKTGRKKRILYLADRNILIDQTMVNDFRPFGSAMAKLSTASGTIEPRAAAKDQTAGRAHRRIDTSYEIYLSLYQAITSTEVDRRYLKSSRQFL